MLRTSECIDWLICIPVRPRVYCVALITRLIRARHLGSRIRNFSSNVAEEGHVGVSGRPSIINVVTRERKNRHRSTGVEGSFFFPLLSRGESSPGFLPHWILFGVPATSEKPPKGSLGTTKRDVIHRSRVHFAFNPTALRCHSWDIKFEV